MQLDNFFSIKCLDIVVSFCFHGYDYFFFFLSGGVLIVERYLDKFIDSKWV